MLSTASPIAKTAFDALQAKRSAVAAGYKPPVVCNEDEYKTLLEQATADAKLKRQTPLVNAGYAVRVLAISHAIHSFVAFHQKKNAKKIQVALLGCGMDVIGLWAGLLDPEKIRIIEVDTQEVCSVKQELFVRQRLVEPTLPLDTEARVFRGRIREAKSSDSAELASNYFLASADLRDVEQLEDALSSMIESNLPTLTISELVLSYLAPSETDCLLKWCANRLCMAPGSSFVALEPLGSRPSENNITNVVEGYKNEYCEQFRAKMERGTSTSGTEITESPFYPVGICHESANQRLLGWGFERAHGCSLGTAASYAARPNGLDTPEIFDEHAALALHLKSYTLICGFSKETEELLRRIMCPWQFAEDHLQPDLSTEIVYTIVEKADEIPVRTLFWKTYEPYYEEYPAVRKMTKNALKTDMAIFPDDDDSALAARWKAFGGCYIVAIQYCQETGDRQLAGCVACRECQRKDELGTLELFRLMVDAKYRGKGIGRALLGQVEKFAVSKKCPKLIAMTLDVLTSANRLYESFGYETEGDEALGKLIKRTYYKRLSLICGIER